MSTLATAAPTPSTPGTVKHPKVAWRTQDAVPPSPGSPPAASPAQPTTPDEVFTVGSGTGSKSPQVEPGTHRVALTDLAKETDDNPFEPGQQRTVFIFTFKPANAVVDGTWRYYTGVSHKSQKLTAVLTALKVSGSSFKKSELLGREAQALIEVTEQGYTRITNVFPT